MTTHYETVTHLTGLSFHGPEDVPERAEFPSRTIFNEWVDDRDDANCPDCLAAVKVSTVESVDNDGPSDWRTLVTVSYAVDHSFQGTVYRLEHARVRDADGEAQVRLVWETGDQYHTLARIFEDLFEEER